MLLNVTVIGSYDIIGGAALLFVGRATERTGAIWGGKFCLLDFHFYHIFDNPRVWFVKDCKNREYCPFSHFIVPSYWWLQMRVSKLSQTRSQISLDRLDSQLENFFQSHSIFAFKIDCSFEIIFFANLNIEWARDSKTTFKWVVFDI